MKTLTHRETAALRRLGSEIKTIREAGGVAQQAVADLMGWADRTAVSKLERGALNMSLLDFLQLFGWLSDGGMASPDHPGVQLYRRYFGPPVRRDEHPGR